MGMPVTTGRPSNVLFWPKHATQKAKQIQKGGRDTMPAGMQPVGRRKYINLPAGRRAPTPAPAENNYRVLPKKNSRGVSFGSQAVEDSGVKASLVWGKVKMLA